MSVADVTAESCVRHVFGFPCKVIRRGAGT